MLLTFIDHAFVFSEKVGIATFTQNDWIGIFLTFILRDFDLKIVN